MTSRVVVNVLRFLLGALFLLMLFAQVFFLPWASGDYARWYPEVADMRWPILRLSIAGLVCVQVGILYVSSSANGPPFPILMLFFGFVAGVGLALLMRVMRTLLVQATTLRREMEAVI